MTIAAGEARLTAADARRRTRRVGALAAPPAHTAHRTIRTTSTLRDAHERAEVEHRLIPLPPAVIGHESIGESLRGARIQPLSGQTGQHATDVGVDDGDVAFEREHQHRTRGVGADAGQRQQRIEIIGDLPVVAFDDGHRESVQEYRATVVTEAGPRIDDLTHSCRRAMRRPWENASRKLSYLGTTRAACVCCSIVSDTRTAHGSRVDRHGKSRRTRWAQRPTATANAFDRLVRERESHGCTLAPHPKSRAKPSHVRRPAAPIPMPNSGGRHNLVAWAMDGAAWAKPHHMGSDRAR